MDVYVKIHHQGNCYRSKTIERGGTEVKFKDEVFFLNVDSQNDEILLEVWDEDYNEDELIGIRKLELSLFTNGAVNKWFSVHSKETKIEGEVLIQTKFKKHDEKKEQETHRLC